MARRERQFKKKMKLKSKPSVHTTRVKLTDSKVGPTPRYAHSSAMLNGILYIFGGFSDKGKIYFNSKSHRLPKILHSMTFGDLILIDVLGNELFAPAHLVQKEMHLCLPFNPIIC